MFYVRYLLLFAILLGCTLAAPCCAQLQQKTLVLLHSMPEIDGNGLPGRIIRLLPGETKGFTGAQVDLSGGLTFAALETPGNPDVLIMGLLIQSEGPLKIVSDPGNSSLPPAFSVPWISTQTDDGVLLSWQPGAAELGQPIGAIPPDNRYTLVLKVNHSENLGVDFSTFGLRHFTVTAVPEPTHTVFFAGLVAYGLTAVHRRKRSRRIADRDETAG